jgi:hypothetical protein
VRINRSISLLCLGLLAACAGAPADGGAAAAQQQLSVTYHGNGSMADRTLQRVIDDAMIVFERTPERVSIVFDAARDLEDWYRNEGFPDVRIEHEIVRLILTAVLAVVLT